jgi:hypothetical protein
MRAVFAAVFVAVLALVAAAPSVATRTADPAADLPLMSSAQILGSLEPEPISCLTAVEWAAKGFPENDIGWAWFGQPHIYVRDFVCEDLVRVAQGTLPADNTTAEFAKLIAHEHAHVLGVTDEGQAECAGMHGAAAILATLGVDAARAAELAGRIVPFYPLPADC